MSVIATDVLTVNNYAVFLGDCEPRCGSYDGDYGSWEYPGIGRSLIFMVAQGLIFFIILYILESDSCRRAVRAIKERHSDDNIQRRQQDVEMMTPDNGVSAGPVEDNDVATERERIVSTPVEQLASKDAVIVRQLNKLYNNSFLAVDRLSVGIARGECFGLLGVNGAGKTTTFGMLTGDTTVSSGDAFLAGMSVVRGVAGARGRLVGFCPQFDALIDQMTVRETLCMYARLRGIDSEHIGAVVDKLIDQLTLQKYANRQAGKLRYVRAFRRHNIFQIVTLTKDNDVATERDRIVITQSVRSFSCWTNRS